MFKSYDIWLKIENPNEIPTQINIVAIKTDFKINCKARQIFLMVFLIRILTVSHIFKLLMRFGRFYLIFIKELLTSRNYTNMFLKVVHEI